MELPLDGSMLQSTFLADSCLHRSRSVHETFLTCFQNSSHRKKNTSFDSVIQETIQFFVSKTAFTVKEIENKSAKKAAAFRTLSCFL